MNLRIQFLIIFFCVGILASFSQQVDFRNISFNDALSEASKSKEIVFIQFGSNCEQCDKVAQIGLSIDNVKSIYRNFIKLNVHRGTPDFDLLKKRYHINPTYPTSLFVNHSGDFLTIMYNKSTSNPNEYINLAATAMAIQKNPPLADYEKKFNSGKYDADFLEKYITILTGYGMETDNLLDEYVGMLSVNELQKRERIEFLIQSGPLIDSRAYRLLHFNYALYDSVFMSFDVKDRIKFNNFTINKSRKKAYADKDSKYMAKVAQFIVGTYNDNRKGIKSYRLNMLRFYQEMKDTTHYVGAAQRYYNSFLKSLDMDTIISKELNSYKDLGNGRRIKGPRFYSIGNQINELAWNIYEMTEDPEKLGMILKWAERVLPYNNSAYFDTYAHILYKLGAFEKAVFWQQKAVDLTDSLGLSNVQLRHELMRMKTRK